MRFPFRGAASRTVGLQCRDAQYAFSVGTHSRRAAQGRTVGVQCRDA